MMIILYIVIFHIVNYLSIIIYDIMKHNEGGYYYVQ